MEDMASLWSYQEENDDLKQKLLYTSLELESLRAEATEETRKNKESLKQLFQLLRMACQERDEAKDQLQKLLNKIMAFTPASANPFFATLPPESPLLKPTRANSSITESNSLSDAYNHSSSPVDSLFDPVSSPEFSNFNNIDNISPPISNMSHVNQQPFVQDYNNVNIPKIDQASLVIEDVAKSRALPQKGKLLQAVLEAGPLLQTLLVAGPLPRWRNPPPLQPFHIPAVSVGGCDDAAPAGQIVNPKNSSSSIVSRSMMNPSQPYVEMSCGSSHQMLAASVLSFSDGMNAAGSSCMANGRLVSAGPNAYGYVPSAKRQRFQ